MSMPSDFNLEFDPFESDKLLAKSSSLYLSDVPASHEEVGAGKLKVTLSASALSILSPHTRSPASANDSFQDSCSDWSSDKRGSVSSKTSPTSAHVTMTDCPLMKAEWPMDGFLRDTDPGNHQFNFSLADGAVNPATLEFNDKLMENDFDFESASSSPGHCNAGKMESHAMCATNHVRTQPAQSAIWPDQQMKVGSTTVLSNLNLQAAPASAPRKTVPVSKQTRHQKAHSQYSLSQSMNGLTTSSSREVSPLSNINPSQESSPPSVINNPPSPATSLNLMSRSGIWPHEMDMSAMLTINQFSGTMPPPSPYNMQALSTFRHVPVFKHFPVGFLGRSQLFIHPTPLKSRVETQIPVKMSLFPLPSGVTRLHLPTHTISKPKLLARPPPERSPDMLELSTMLVCTSAMLNEENKRRTLARAAAGIHGTHGPIDDGSDKDEKKLQNGGEVRICEGCIIRERKRAARKKIKKVEEQQIWMRDENRRVVVFNTHEIKEWQPAATATTLKDSTLMGRQEPNVPPGSVQVECPMRIACYCRHQNEKIGFQVIFTLKDFQGRLIAQEMSSSIMITDDHKSHPPPTLPGQASSVSDDSAAPGSAINTLGPPAPSFHHPTIPLPDVPQFQQKQTSPFTAKPISGLSNATIVTPNSRNLSRPASPGGPSGPSAKKRKASASIKLPSSLAMTPRNVASGAAPPSAPVDQTSPFSPSMPLAMAEAIFPGHGPGTMSQAPLSTGPPTPNSKSNEHNRFGSTNRSTSLDKVAMPDLYSAPTSAHPSRAPSPNSLRNSAGSMQQAQLAQAVASGLLSMPMAINATRPPVIHKIIPNEGPKSGGIEVTILGSSFSQGLEVIFGDQRATTTTFWGDTSLVCLLPPSPVAGPVLVTCKNQCSAAQPFTTTPKQHSVFKYVDDDEQQLIRSALAVLGQKMTGKMEDARELARRILGDGNSWRLSGSSAPGDQRSASGGASGFNTLSFNIATESQLLKVLELIDLDDSSHKCRWNVKRTTGQTMLHLACALGLHRLVAGLLSHDAMPDARDNGGFTPMHLAAMNGHVEVVRRLVSAGADPSIRSLSGLTVADMAPANMTRPIRKIERFARSNRFGSLHSRSNSATSLRSLWEGPPGTRGYQDVSEVPESDRENEETFNCSSLYNFSEDDSEDVDDSQILGLGRRHVSRTMTSPSISQANESHVHAHDAAFLSPTATMAAWKEQMTAQFQQLQQAVAGPLQSIAQLPNLAVIPTLQDYQLLASLQGMRRLAELIPNIGRPGSSGNQSPGSPDNKWWESLFPSSAPPAYEDLYPQADMDGKKASDSQAAAEVEADVKCTNLYDQDMEKATSRTQAPSTSTISKRPLPALLQIGRRHAITQEQRANLQQLRSEKLVRWSKDRKLFFIWIPLLVIMICASLHSALPSLFSCPLEYLRSLVVNSVSAKTSVENVADVAGAAINQLASNHPGQTV